MNAAQRCHKIVQSLLSFARQHKPERKPVHVHELIEATVEILAYQMRTSNIQVDTRFDPQLPKVMADPHQLQQVFLNLINNARQAIEACRPSGWVRVTTESGDDRVRVVLQDNGPGISAENLPKIFNPFFTTKEVGKGTGLGLSLCYGIIQEHGGNISVQSKEGEGVTFVVELPVALAPAETAAAQSPAAPAAPATAVGQGKKVLVVDDEDSVLNLIREALAPQGYQLDIVPDGETALRQLEEHDYDLTVCDWRMPGLNGQQVFERLHARDPEAASRLIFVSGDVVNEKTHEFLEREGKVCLTKPFSIGDFRTAVGEALKAA